VDVVIFVLSATPLALMLADLSPLPLYRYSPNSPYESNDANAWRGYLHPTPGHTGPWTYSPDRQVHTWVAVFYSDCVFGPDRVGTGVVCDYGNRCFLLKRQEERW
jgi:hypothetical protein